MFTDGKFDSRLETCKELDARLILTVHQLVKGYFMPSGQ